MPNPTDIIFNLRAENADLKAKLAESEAAVKDVTVSTDALGDTGEATGAQLDAAFRRAQSALQDYGAGISSVNDPLRGYAHVADDAAGKTGQLVEGFSRLPGPIGSAGQAVKGLTEGIGLLPKAVGAATIAIGAAVVVFEAVHRAGKFLGETLAGTNTVLDGTADRFDTMSKLIGPLGGHFRDAAAGLREWTRVQRDGVDALNDDAAARKRQREAIDETKNAVSGNVVALLEEVRVLEAARTELERTGPLTETQLERWSERAGELADRFREFGLTVPDSIARYTAAAQEATTADSTLDHAHRELLEVLGDGTEEAASRATEALDSVRERSRETVDSIVRDAERIAGALEREQAQPRDPFASLAPDTGGDVERKREEVAALREQTDQLIVTEEQIQALAAAEQELAALEREHGDARQDAGEQQHEQMQRQQVDLRDVARLTDDAIARVLDFRAQHGEAGAAATGELDALIGAWIAQQNQIGVTGDDVRQFGEDFETAFARASDQAQRHSAQIADALAEQQRAAEDAAADLEDLNRQHEDLARQAGSATDELDAQASALGNVESGAKGAAEGLGDIGKSGRLAAADLEATLDVSRQIHTEWSGIVAEMRAAKQCAADLAEAI